MIYFFGNTLFLASFTSLFLAQAIKGTLYLIRRKRKNPKELLDIVTWRTGGMPSSHAAAVCSLCTSIAISEGIASNLFIVAFWFSLVVLRDAIGVRRSAGLTAKALNNLGKQAAEKLGIDFSPVKEIQGHTLLEVIIGGLLGIAISIAFWLF